MNEQIDWSKAPKWATHFTPAKREHHRPVFWKVVDGVARKAWCMSDDCSRVDEIFTYGPDGCLGFNMDDAVSIHATPTTWDSTGLPPVGMVCEARIGVTSWVRCTVIAHAREDDQTDAIFTFAQSDRSPAWVWRREPADFRPLRTPEQLAAEAREKAVDEMAQRFALHGANNVPWKDLFAQMYDAGYRKVEAAE